MADGNLESFTALTAASAADTDLVYIWDIGEAGIARSKKMTVAELKILTQAGRASIQHFEEQTLPAGSWGPFTTNGAEAGTTVYGSNEFDHFAFDASTEEAVYFQWEVPQDYNGGVIRWGVNWDAIATASGTAIFGLSGGSFGNDEALSTALGTERTVTDTLLAVGDRQRSPNDATGITLSGTPVAGDFVLLKLVRKTSSTITVDVLFLGLQIQYQTKTTEPGAFA